MSNENENECWATEENPAEAARKLGACCEQSIHENTFKAERAYKYGSLFEGYTLTNLSGYGANVNSNFIGGEQEDEIFKNTARSLCYAFVNKSAANDSPRPQFVTKNADYDQQLKAADLDLAITAEMDSPQGMFNDVDDLVRQGVLLAAGSTGQFYVFSLVYENSVDVQLELDDSLTVGVYKEESFGKVKMLCRTVWINPEIAAQRFGDEFAESISRNVDHQEGSFESGRGHRGQRGTVKSLSRRVVKVHMGWDVAAQREMFTLKDGTILRDNPKYTRSTPPCVEWCYKRDLSGTTGTPLVHEMYTLDVLYNRIMGDVVAAERKTPQVIIAAQRGTEDAGDVAAQMQDVQGVQVLETSGPPGTSVNIQAVNKFSKDSVALMGIVEQQAYDNTQISKNHATGAKPPGTTSGVQEAMAASYYTEGHADAERRLIAMRVQGLARIMAQSIQELVDGPSGYEKMVGKNRFRKSIKGSELDLDLNKYDTNIKAVSEEKGSPENRLQEAKSWMKDPTIQFTGLDYYNFLQTYDTDSSVKVAYGNQAWAQDQVEMYLKSSEEDMMDPEFFQPPEPSMGLDGLQTALGVVNEAFLKARSERVPLNRLRFFESFLQQCLALIHEEQGRMASLQNPQIQQ